MARTGRPTKPARPKLCRRDEDCRSGYICESGECKKVKKSINVAYLFYLSGNRRFMEVMGLYWHRLGKKGYRIVFPFYWNFWGPGRTHTFVGPFHYWKERKGFGFNVWPLLFYASYGRKGKHFTFIPFGHGRRYKDEKSFGFITPVGFFYHSSAKNRYRTNLLIPWWVGTATPHKAFTWVFPLNFYWRRERQKRWLLFPLVYASRREASYKAFVFPLVWVWGSHGRSNAIGFPLVWHFGSKERSTTIAGPFYHMRRGSWWSSGLFPILFFGRDRTRKATHAALLPLFYYRRYASGTRTFMGSPLFFYHSDQRERSRLFLWTAPFIFSQRSGSSGTDLAFPFYFRHFDKRQDLNIVAVPPFLYYRDYQQRNTFLFPLWWNFRHRKTGTYTRALLPLYYQSRSTSGRVHTVVGPFFMAHGGGRDWKAGLLPVLFFGSGAKGHHQVVFPLFWHFRNKAHRTRTLVVGSFFWRTSRKGWHTGVAPIFFMGRSRATSYDLLFPLIWHFHNHRRKEHTLVLGPAFARYGKKGYRAGIAPFLFFGSMNGRSHVVVPALLSYVSDGRNRSKTLQVGPVFYFRRNESWGWGVFPLFFFGRKYSSSGLVSSRIGAMPFFYMSRDHRRELLVTPLGGYSHNYRTGTRTGVVGPFVWHQGRRYWGFAMLPWVYHITDLEKKRTTVVAFPYIRSTTPRRTATIFFPLFWRFKSPEESNTLFFPFFWRMRRKSGFAADVVFPFYFNIKKNKKTFFMAGPYYRYRAPKRSIDGVWPLFHYDMGAKSSYAHFLPFFYYANNYARKRRFILAGPFYSHSTRTRENTGLVPIMFWGRRRTRRYRVGFPFYWDFEDVGQKKKRLLFVGPFFYHRRGIERGGGLAPLFWYRSDTAGMRQVTLFPLFHFKKDPSRLALFFLPFGFSRDRARGSHWGFVGPYIWRSDSVRRHDVVFPLFWRFHNRFNKTTTMLIPPLLYWGQHAPDKKIDIVFPFFWMRRTILGKTFAVFPFFWYDTEYHQSRTVAVFPLFYRKRHYPSRTTTWIFPPALWIKVAPRRSAAILFPLLWHFGNSRRKRSTTVFFPLYWDFKRPNKRTSIFFPFVWYFDRPSKRTLFVVNTYYRKNKDNSTYRLICFPFFDVGRARPGDFHLTVLAGMFGYERVGKNKYIRLFFIPIQVASGGKSRKPRSQAQNRAPPRNRIPALPLPASYPKRIWSPI